MHVWGQIRDDWSKLLQEEREHYGDIPGDSKQIVEGYIDQWKESDKGYIFTEVEKVFGPYELVPGVVISVTPDAIVEDTMGRHLLLEMKTGKKLPPEDFHLWNLQTLIYVWGVRQAGYKVEGVLWDHVRTKIPTVPRILKDGTMSKRILDTTASVYTRALIENNLSPDDYADVIDVLRNRKEFYSRVKLPVKEKMLFHLMSDVRTTATEIRDFMHTHITRDVSQMKCPRCMYRGLCEAALMGGDEDYVLEHDFVPKERRNYEEREHGRDTDESDASA